MLCSKTYMLPKLPSLVLVLLLSLFLTARTVVSQDTLGTIGAETNFNEDTEEDEDRAYVCTGNDIMIIATHPEDEIICCSGVISRAIKHGMCVQVVVLTNGDYLGSTAEKGIERQRESLMGLKELGLKDPNSVIFLGYPENGLRTLYIDYNDKDAVFVTNKMINETYGAYGKGEGDYHFVKTGKHAKYNYPSLFEDVKSVISEYDPTYIFITASNLDSNGDHKYTYKIIKDALEELKLSNLRSIYSTTISSGDTNWPNHIDPFTKIKDIAIPEDFDQKPTRINVPLSMRTTDWESNQKYQAMRTQSTQEDDECPVFFRFIHRDELFFSKGAKSMYSVPIADAGEDKIGCSGSTIYLDGSKTTAGSGNYKKEDLIFSWTQSAGPTVDLKDASTERPHFVFKSDTPLSTPVELEFELTVKNPYIDTPSFPNSVVVTIVPDNYKKYGKNIALDATVSASSETVYTGQVAQAAVDGVVDGLLRVSPTEFGSKRNEWVAEGERGSAWIKLSWDGYVTVGKIVLYDRISCKNHVLGGILSFSDGSEIRVGELNNMGGPTTIEFEPKTVDSIKFGIESVSETTAEDGLAEIMVYELDSNSFYCGHEDGDDDNDDGDVAKKTDGEKEKNNEEAEYEDGYAKNNKVQMPIDADTDNNEEVNENANDHQENRQKEEEEENNEEEEKGVGEGEGEGREKERENNEENEDENKRENNEEVHENEDENKKEQEVHENEENEDEKKVHQNELDPPHYKYINNNNNNNNEFENNNNKNNNKENEYIDNNNNHNERENERENEQKENEFIDNNNVENENENKENEYNEINKNNEERHKGFKHIKDTGKIHEENNKENDDGDEDKEFMITDTRKKAEVKVDVPKNNDLTEVKENKEAKENKENREKKRVEGGKRSSLPAVGVFVFVVVLMVVAVKFNLFKKMPDSLVKKVL